MPAVRRGDRAQRAVSCVGSVVERGDSYILPAKAAFPGGDGLCARLGRERVMARCLLL
jgi:hypothetical protein